MIKALASWEAYPFSTQGAKDFVVVQSSLNPAPPIAIKRSRTIPGVAGAILQTPTLLVD